ncbi:MAG: hypothetical protein JW839_14090 [Candidatus Lokiarchaeota archaeon]|nr:hypothetical protein [Candidatus Lokiarchaeota archaeon]
MKFRKDDKQKETEPVNEGGAEPAKKEEGAAVKRADTEKFDLITIVSSVEMDIPEKEPPYSEVLYDFIPESEQRVTANREDHVSKRTE